MKKLDLSRVAPLALGAAFSLVLCFVVVDSIVALGMSATAALKSLQPVSQPLLVESNEAHRASVAIAQVRPIPRRLTSMGR
jgi:hypothetical protein